MLFYVPLESLKERYTTQWSAPKTGWLERNWIAADVEYQRIDGVQDQTPKTIKTGCVLDAVARSQFCFSQISQLLQLAEAGKITDEDVIYFDDFWTPGIEALPYAFTLLGIKPKMYAFLHAQSVDEFDFTHPMRYWMRHFERGIAESLAGIFVCGPCLQELVVLGGIAPKDKVHVTGHPFNSSEVRERMPEPMPWETIRENKVVFSSRWDAEKNPKFFLKVAAAVIASKEIPDVEFSVCTSAPKLRSNDQEALKLLEHLSKLYPGQLTLKENLTKEEYYQELWTAKVQMNTANQDFVAITLLEASVAGCYPVYPYFRSFPETLLHRQEYMYQHLDFQSAVNKVISVLKRDDLWTAQAIQNRQWIHKRFDTAWLRMLNIMNIEHSSLGYHKDPYNADFWPQA